MNILYSDDQFAESENILITSLPPPRTIDTGGASNKNYCRNAGATPDKCRPPHGDRDDDSPANPELMLAHCQTTMPFGDSRRNVVAQSLTS